VGDFEELKTIVKIVAMGWTYPGRVILGNEMQPKFHYQFFYRLGDGARAPLTGSQVRMLKTPEP
jgi:hypothetical protein